jgi:hypothetical protein
MKNGRLKWMTVGVAAWMAVPSAWSQGTFMFTNSNRSRTVPFTGCDGKPIAGAAAHRGEVLARRARRKNNSGQGGLPAEDRTETLIESGSETD